MLNDSAALLVASKVKNFVEGWELALRLIQPEIRSGNAVMRMKLGSARRWRAVFGGPPKTSFRKFARTENGTGNE